MAMRVLTCGDSALMVELGSDIKPETAQRISALAGVLAAQQGLELVPTYCGLMVHYDPLQYLEGQVREFIAHAAGQDAATQGTPVREIQLPVCYGGSFGPDLEDVAAYSGLSTQQVIDIHSGGVYRVYMLGFMPGFPYLGGMDKRIAMPRLDSPRAAIPWGSVGIAGEQTGVYPAKSPGGWRLIGRTPTRLFDPQSGSTLLEAGMHLRFKPITLEEYLELGGEPQ